MTSSLGGLAAKLCILEQQAELLAALQDDSQLEELEVHALCCGSRLRP